jgi:hypothetical protein
MFSSVPAQEEKELLREKSKLSASWSEEEEASEAAQSDGYQSSLAP